MLSGATASWSAGRLSIDDRVVLTDVAETLRPAPATDGPGVFLQLQLSEPLAYSVTPLGRIEGLQRFTLTHRTEPYWLRPARGEDVSQVPAETQWLLAQLDDDSYLLIVPLLDGAARFALQGHAGGLQLTCETNDPYTRVAGGVGLYVAQGPDPYALMQAGAREVARQLGAVPLRAEKPVPAFVDLFGWCTWDAFYHEVDPAGVERGLQSFAAGGVAPRFLILDDGWQSIRTMPTGEKRLTAFAPNAKFQGDLGSLVRTVKDTYGIREFLVWHAVVGYWGGVDGDALPNYGVVDAFRSYGVGVLTHEPTVNLWWWGNVVGLVSPERIGQFYDDYHAALAAQGVDGVKVDSQAMLESLGTGRGGRVAVNRAYRAGLEASVANHFDGQLINCMSHAQETFYGSPGSTVIRTSIDFWPRRPETHGLHLYTNAQVGAWFGEFMLPDWDMFQSGHAWGAFHAAGRALSGGPVYVSDKPGAHDFALLRKLVTSDGTILRADGPGRPTLDSLMTDPTQDPVALKIFNTNGPRTIVGVFNAQYHEDPAARVTVRADVAPADVPGGRDGDFVAFAHQRNALWRTTATERWALELAEGEWELVTYAPIEAGAAVVGLADKFNSGGAVITTRRPAENHLEVELRDGGEFIAWCERAPAAVENQGQTIVFQHDAATGALRATLPPGRQTVTLRW